MPRRASIARKTKYETIPLNRTTSRFSAKLMHDGKRILADRIIRQALARAEAQAHRPGIEVLEAALRNATPIIEVKPRRVGGATYQVPVEIRGDRRLSLGVRWLVQAARKRTGKSMGEKLAADFWVGVESIRDRLGANAVPIQIPIGREDGFLGMIDLVEMKAVYYRDELGNDIEVEEIPAELRAEADKHHHLMIEAVADMDDELTQKYLEGVDFTVEEIKRGLRLGTLSTRLIPVLGASALRNKGVQRMLDAVIDYLPSPLDVPPMIALDPKTGEELIRRPDDSEPFSALAFKIAADPFVGKLAFFRVYSGTLKAGSYVMTINAKKGVRRERIGRLLQMHANHREELEEVYAGDIAAAVGLKDTFTGDTLADPDHLVILESMTFPEPVIEVKIEPKTKADQDKLTIALQRLAEEDPTFRVKTDPETAETLIAGMGELHLDVLVDRMVREFKVAANIGKPQVSYRETIRRAAEGNGRFVRQTGGKGQYGHAVIRIEPQEKGAGYEFVDKIVGGTIPREYIKSVDAGIREALETGIYAGFPVVDVKATLIDGSYHEVDSSEMAFKIAGSMAVKDAFHKASPAILEPIMRVEVTTSTEFMGDVIGDLNSRRGQVEAVDQRGATEVIRAFVPLSAMFGYVTDLRSMTQGRATSSLEFSHYAEVPASLAAELVAKSKN